MLLAGSPVLCPAASAQPHSSLICRFYSTPSAPPHPDPTSLCSYIEACESGSIFEGLLADDLEVYATTAANSHESSWGTYCPGMNPSPPPEFTTCLADLYRWGLGRACHGGSSEGFAGAGAAGSGPVSSPSPHLACGPPGPTHHSLTPALTSHPRCSVAWLENSDHADLTVETLKKQFQLVKQRTSQNFTFAQGSHVLRFGTLDLAEEPAADFLGELNTGGWRGVGWAGDGWVMVGVWGARRGEGRESGEDAAEFQGGAQNL